MNTQIKIARKEKTKPITRTVRSEDTGSCRSWDWWSSIDHKFTTLPTTTSPNDSFCFALCLFFGLLYVYFFCTLLFI